MALIADVDADILRLIARRTRMLNELPQGRESTRYERELRASWEANAARISHDPRLVRQLFALLQQVECLNRRQEEGPPNEGFNLSPSHLPVDVTIKGLSDCRRSRILGAMAAGTGSPMVLRDILINDPLVEMVKAFNQLAPCLRWEEDGRLVCVAEAKRLGGEKALLDRAVHVGDDMLNFLLVLGTMAARPCRLKIMGGSSLKLADLSPLRHFLPALGARFTSIVPGQEGLPARLEASGILPDAVSIPPALEHDAALAVCLGLLSAPRDHSIRVDLEAHPGADMILAELADVAAAASLIPRVEGRSLYLAPEPRPAFPVPQNTRLYVDLPLSCVILSLPAFAGGKVEVEGFWPENEAGSACRAMLEAAGLHFRHNGSIITSGDGKSGFDNDLFAVHEKHVPERLLPLAALLAAVPALRGGTAVLPESAMSLDLQILDDFLSRIRLEREGRNVRPGSGEFQDLPWGSPNSMWGAALALAAFYRPNVKLLNPGIVVERMPGFWQWYNGLPNPTLHRPPVAADPQVAGPQSAPAPRRRIRAGYMPEEHMPAPVRDDDDQD